MSCDNKIIENEVADNYKATAIVDSTEVGSVISDKASQKILYIGETNYLKALYNNPIIGYSSSTSDPLSESKFVTFDGSIKTPWTKSLQSYSYVNVLINGRNISTLNLATKSQDIVSDLYGKDVSFTISPVTKSQDDSSKSISLYIPEIVEITSPKIETEEYLYPYCYYKDFVLRWNSDLKNENGLIVIVEWYGSYFDGQHENRYVRNGDLISIDDGEEVLNNELFDDIPDNALCYITLLRGNLENIELLEENLAYLVAGESHAVLPLVLVRDL
ncbi:MAG: hypothetical protein LBG80_13765 [Bacteroidales bacterium]|nr:hypothetical protein [Bacteroidales bacterium]